MFKNYYEIVLMLQFRDYDWKLDDICMTPPFSVPKSYLQNVLLLKLLVTKESWIRDREMSKLWPISKGHFHFSYSRFLARNKLMITVRARPFLIKTPQLLIAGSETLYKLYYWKTMLKGNDQSKTIGNSFKTKCYLVLYRFAACGCIWLCIYIHSRYIETRSLIT